MANQWLRLWHDMPNDPKWRTIARVSGQPITSVISVYIHLLVIASNASERGRTHDANTEDIASALDLDAEQVQQICSAMQGRVLDGDLITGWEKRQVAREDGSAERAKAWREQKKNAAQQQANASERKRTPDTDTDTEKKKNKPKSCAPATRLPDDWQPSPDDISFCKSSRPDLNPNEIADGFRDYWIAQPGAKGRKADWPATWRNWVRNQRVKPPATGQPFESAKDRSRREFAEAIFGKRSHEQLDERDITGVASRVD